MLRSLGLYIAIALGLLLAWATTNPVAVLGSDAPSSSFSSERAMSDVAAIARTPHPIGSAANSRVREHLAGRLASLGFTVEVLRGPAVVDGQTPMGAFPETLVAVRPGADRDLPPVAIMSHYDSVPGSPGAADDAMGVAVSLEVARALGGPQARDLVLVVTDGEEAGLFGAKAFFANHPLAKRLGALINLEARGASGPALMFETSPQAGALVRRYAAAAPHPVASSLMAWVYDAMPNDTDFTHAKQAGLAGLNFAVLGRPYDYHSATATPANLDRRSLQSMGDQVLGAVADLSGPEPLPARSPGLVFSDVFGLVLVAYPAWAGWLVILVAGGLIVVAVRRLGPGRPRAVEMLRGVGGFLVIAVMTTLAVRAVGRLVPPDETYFQGRNVANFGLYLMAASLTAGCFVVGVMANLTRGEGRVRATLVSLGLGVVCCLAGGWGLVGVILAVVSAGLVLALFGRPTAPTALWGGALYVGLVLAVALQILAPTTAFVIAWPLLIGAALAAATSLGAEPDRRSTLALVVVGAVVFAWTARLANLAFDGLGMATPEIVAPFAAFSLMALTPLAARAGQKRYSRLIAGSALAAALVGVIYIAVHDPATPRTPRPSHVIHIYDYAPQFVHSLAWKATALARPDTWTRGVLGEAAKPESFPALGATPLLAQPISPGPGLAPPTLAVRREGARVVFDIATPGAREVRIALKGAPLTGVTLGGLPVAAPKPGRDGWMRLRWYAPRDGFTVAFDVPASAGGLDWEMAATHDGWLPAVAPPPPRTATVMPWQGSDSSVAITRGKASW